MESKKVISTGITHKSLIITIITLIILTVLAVFVINRTSIISKIKQAIQKEKKPLFAYEIYNNQDENNIKVLVTVNSEDGIEYIIMPNETRIDCYEKTSKAIDYVAAKNSEGTFKIKEKGKDEKTETIKLDDQTIHDKGLALDETDQSGYKEFTIENKLQSLKEKFTSYSYKIGENGEWTQVNNVQNGIYKLSELDYDLIQKKLINSDKTLNVYTKISDNIGNTLTIKKNYNVDITEDETTASSESLLKAVEEYNKGNGKYAVTVSDQTYNLKMYNIQGNLKIGSNVIATMGNESDVAQGTEEAQMAKNMVVLKVNGDLTIDENSTLTTFSKEYGGPKGLMIYCTGTITNNGDISQSGKGAHAKGQNVYLLRRTDGSYDYVSAEGATGGTRVSASYWEEVSGNSGNNGINRQTGGGASGDAISYCYHGWSYGRSSAVYCITYSGNGSNGTSYSGGFAGSNGTCYDASGDLDKIRGWHKWQAKNGEIGYQNGGSGAGGLLTIYGNNIVNSSTGKIEANGSNGGTGGGSINIFYGNNYKNENVIEANGGTPKGGNGTVTITNLGDKTPPETFEIEASDIKSKEFTIKGETTDKESGIRNYTIVVEKEGTTVGKVTNTRNKENKGGIKTNEKERESYNINRVSYNNNSNINTSRSSNSSIKKYRINWKNKSCTIKKFKSRCKRKDRISNNRGANRENR